MCSRSSSGSRPDVIATLVNGAALGPFFATFLTNARRHRPVGLGAQVHPVRRHHGDRLLLQGHDGVGRRGGVGRAVNQAVVIAFLGVFAFNYVFTQTLLATHPEITLIR